MDTVVRWKLDQDPDQRIRKSLPFSVNELVNQQANQQVDEQVNESANQQVTIAPSESFGTFFQREFFSIVSVAQAVSGDPSAGEDIAAEAMLKASQQWGRISEFDKPGAWVRRVAVNLANNRRRRTVVHRKWLARQPKHVTATIQPELDDELWLAVSELPRKQRAAIALRYIDDLSVSEIGEILECSTSTATSHLHKARAQLRSKLEREPRNER